MLKESNPNSFAGVWSEIVNGLSGRLRVEFENLRPGLRFAVYLELKNYSFEPIAVTNQPDVHAEMFDSDGEPVRISEFAMSGPILNPQWAVIPRDAYLGFRIDMQTVGVPAREQGVVLIAVGGKAWQVKVGKYMLKIGSKFERKEEHPPNQWVGELALPPVEVVITEQMLAAN